MFVSICVCAVERCGGGAVVVSCPVTNSVESLAGYWYDITWGCLSESRRTWVV